MIPAQCLRDLYWALSAPQLLSSPSPSFSTQMAQPLLQKELRFLEPMSQSLVQSLQEAKSLRLGVYYESLLKFYFKLSPKHELLHYNQAIYEDKRTLGAFDFIYRNEARQTVHRESAVKFYLGIPTETQTQSSWADWWGPNKDDRLDRKIDHMFNRQIHLSQTPQAQAFLSKQQVQVDTIEVDFKGYLFYPFEQQMAPPKDTHPSHQRSVWMTVSQFCTLRKPGFWEVLPKLRWLSPAVAGQTLLDTKSMCAFLQHHFQNNTTPLLLANYENLRMHAPEQTRLFVTSDTWQTDKETHEPRNA